MNTSKINTVVSSLFHINTIKHQWQPGKTKFIVFGSEAMVNKIKHCFPVDILGHQLLTVKRVCNLGVFFYFSLSFRNHISSVCKSSFLALRNFASIRKYLTISTATTAANALLSCRFDYCNSLFTVYLPLILPGSNIFKIA
jgi:hypothetical protein